VRVVTARSAGGRSSLLPPRPGRHRPEVAVEELPAVRTLGARMQVGDERFDSDEICRLYESSGYPLQRDVSR
jgi:hypothetical protein